MNYSKKFFVLQYFHKLQDQNMAIFYNYNTTTKIFKFFANIGFYRIILKKLK